MIYQKSLQVDSEDVAFPLVSILINNYNYGKYVSDAIDSALKQTYLNIEVIVIDDGSSDNSKEVINRYKGKIKVHFKENGGQASAFNVGVYLSIGEIICFLDADDTYEPTKIEQLVKIYNDNEQIGYVFDKVIKVDEQLKPIAIDNRSNKTYLTDYRINVRSGSLKNHLVFTIPATSGLSFKRGLINTIFPIPESESCSMCENYMKYIAVGTTIGAFLDTSLTKQRIHGSNLFTKEKKDLSMAARISILTSYWLAKNFPDLKKFANTQFALGLSFWAKTELSDEKYQKLITEYFSKLSLFDKCMIIGRSLYYFFKIR